jgi:putative peptide zinc metalloprotease protein
MSAALFSQSWYRVADLRVRLRQHAQINRHRYRGQVWYVLQDHVTGQFHRFTPAAYQVIGLMDGQRTLQEIWQIACERLGDHIPSQDEIIELVSRLYQANVLHSDRPPDIADLHYRQRELKRKKFLQQMKSPLGIRIPLFDPEGFLNATYPLLRPLFGMIGGLLWLLLVFYGLLQAGIHWGALSHNVSDQVLSLENLFVIALIYPLVKAVHELGHAYAVKRWGGEVHEMGLMLLVFIPIPYVDATAATAFGNKYQRMLVGAAGIMTELSLAALAMLVWVSAEPGVVRTVAYNVMIITGVSTVLFNGNPLLRYDAYYVLADWLEFPNLASRANQYVGYLVKRYLYGVKDLPPQVENRTESFWLAGYSIASFTYRIIIMIAIAMFVASKYFMIGVLFAIWSIYQTLVAPSFKLMLKPMNDPSLRQRMHKVYLYSVAIIGGLLLFLLIVPLPYSTLAEGVLRVADEAIVRVEERGFIDKIVAEPGHRVSAGEVLVELVNPELDTQVSVLAAQIDEAEARYLASLRDPAAAEIIRTELGYLRHEHQQAQRRQGALLIRSRGNGIFEMPGAGNMPGRFAERGQILGYVVDYQELPVLAPVAEERIDTVRYHTRRVEVRFVSDRNTTYPATIRRIVPATSRELPSRVLSTEGGGQIALDPSESQRLMAFKKYFQFEIDLGNAPRQRRDERVYILFIHDAEPLAWRWYRDLRRVFLRQFYV